MEKEVAERKIIALAKENERLQREKLVRVN
jgi:hypothetical protein